MPFDEENEEHDGGGGGRDKKHEGIEELIDTLFMTVKLITELEGKCKTCTAGGLGLHLLARTLKKYKRLYGHDRAANELTKMFEAIGKNVGLDVIAR